MSRFTLPLRWIEHAGDGVRNLRPARAFGRQLFLALGREPVNPDALLIVRNLPIRGDPFLPLQPMKRGVERAGVHLKDVSRVSANRLADAIAVLRAPAKRLQDEQVERALEQLDAVLVAWSHGFPQDEDTLHPWHVECLHPRSSKRKVSCQSQRSTCQGCFWPSSHPCRAGVYTVPDASVSKPVDSPIPLYSSSARHAYAIETPWSGCYGSR